VSVTTTAFLRKISIGVHIPSANSASLVGLVRGEWRPLCQVTSMFICLTHELICTSLLADAFNRQQSNIQLANMSLKNLPFELLDQIFHPLLPSSQLRAEALHRPGRARYRARWIQYLDLRRISRKFSQSSRFPTHCCSQYQDH
jgi:hypothetical protein